MAPTLTSVTPPGTWTEGDDLLIDVVADDIDPLAESRTELSIPVHQQIAGTVEKTILAISEIPGDLLHPCFVGIGRAAGKVHTAIF